MEGSGRFPLGERGKVVCALLSLQQADKHVLTGARECWNPKEPVRRGGELQLRFSASMGMSVAMSNGGAEK